MVLEACYGWYWAADVLAELGASVHLAHPLGVKGFAYRRVKNVERDAVDLVDLFWMGRLPESWIAPPVSRELRELVRHRAKMVGLRSSLKCQITAVLAGAGVGVALSDLFGVAGRELLERVVLPSAMRAKVNSALRLVDAFDFEIDTFTQLVSVRLQGDPGYLAVQTIPGVGPIVAAVFVAEIGDVGRFPGPTQLTSWAGLTPRHRESDTTVHRGRITKQASKLVRWAAIEAVARYHGGDPIAPSFRRIAQRRGVMIARVAAGRKLLCLVFYGLRDGEIRCLREAA